MKSDVFICCVVEDEKSVAIPIKKKLEVIDNRYEISLLEISTTDIGIIRNKIEEALKVTRYGVIVISESFLKFISHNAEFDSFIIKQNIAAEKIILPVWHNVTSETVEKYSSALTDRLSATTDDGLDYVIAMIVAAIRPAKANESQFQKTNLRQSIEKLFSKPKFTLDLYRTWHSDMIRESRIAVSAWVKLFKNAGNMPSISELRTKREVIEKHISRLLFYFEHWAIFSKQDLIDKELILKLLSSYLAWYYDIFIIPIKKANANDIEVSTTIKDIEQEVFSKEMEKYKDLKFD